MDKINKVWWLWCRGGTYYESLELILGYNVTKSFFEFIKQDHTELFQARKKPNSEAGVWTGVAENREEIHKFMQREAMKRYS